MIGSKVMVKLFATENLSAPLDEYVRIFHRWIRQEKTGELLIDVADYTHVHQGIGVLLVGHGADFAVDQEDGRPGLLFSRKRALSSQSELVQDALESVFSAARELDDGEGSHRPKAFDSHDILFRFPERLHFSNDAAGLDAVRDRIVAALARLVPNVEYALTREGSELEMLTVRAVAS